LAKHFVEASTVKISGGTFNDPIRFNLLECEITGGEFFGLIDGAVIGDGGCSIRGGQFAGGFAYTGSNLSRPAFTFYGDLAETEPVLIGPNKYESFINGTLADGSALSQKVSCVPTYSPCDGVKMISD
jgi:hypothetical protein